MEEMVGSERGVCDGGLGEVGYDAQSDLPVEI